jgi:squalene-hopene/tetraprenyl-beta-curcumene cyclase
MIVQHWWMKPALRPGKSCSTSIGMTFASFRWPFCRNELELRHPSQGERSVTALRHIGWKLTLAIPLLALALTSSGQAADPEVGPSTKDVKAVLDKAIGFLRKHQNDDGSFQPKLGGPGITALVTAGLIRNGVSPDDPMVKKALGYLEKNIKADGGVYGDKSLANYTTCIALMAFHEANTSGKYTTILKNGGDFLKGLQTNDGPDNPQTGGVGYSGKGRPDLSNTQFFVEAMLAAGVPKDDPAVQRALKFISQCQNLPGEHNTQPFAKKASPDDKGGFTYNPVVSDKNPNKTPEGGLRSYGAMTYAGLKSFLHAGVDKRDARVQAAVDWIARHYTLDEHPGQGQAGLYYYYHTFGKAMNALGNDSFVDASKKKHDWRRDLFEALKKRQKPDGSWSNDNKAYQENNPELATAFAVLTLSYCQPPKK